MAIITKIREKSGVAVGVVAIAMIAFILAGLFTTNNTLFNTGPVLGEIDGKDVPYQEFNQRLQALSNMFVQTYGRQPQETEVDRLRQQIWQEYMAEFGYGPEFEALGLQVTPAEITDLMGGKNISPSVSAYFRNQQGEVDHTMLDNFMQNYRSNPRMAALHQWISYPLKNDRLLEKYAAMLENSTYATKVEAEREYQEQNTTASLEYLYIPYTTVPDSTAGLSDADVEAYYRANPAKYERAANRAIEYLQFPIQATPEDEAAILEEVKGEIEAFKTAANDTAFVEAKTENADPSQMFRNMAIGELPAGLNLTAPTAGEVYGPVKEGNFFNLYKIVGFEDDSVYWMRASHILFKQENKADAERVLQEIKDGAEFAKMAGIHGTDGTRARGGDLGWFREGQMVDAFNKAVLDASGTGLLPKLVETQFGYHIVEVTAEKTKKRAQVAVLAREIVPSTETQDELYRKVGKFRQAKNYEELKKMAEETGMILYQALNIRPEATTINNLRDNAVKGIVRWAYSDETSVGEISEEFELEGQYLLAVVTSARDKGVAPLEDVRQEVRTEALKQKQAAIILGKLSAASGALPEIASKYGKGANVHTADDVALNGFSLNRVGLAPITMGKLAKMGPGETSAPIADENGVVIVRVIAKTPAAAEGDPMAYKSRIEERRSGTVYFDLQQAIEKLKEVQDVRYKFF
jgi:peptidyl-prolyl cis-trans isomerase D